MSKLKALLWHLWPPDFWWLLTLLQCSTIELIPKIWRRNGCSAVSLAFFREATTTVAGLLSQTSSTIRPHATWPTNTGWGQNGQQTYPKDRCQGLQPLTILTCDFLMRNALLYSICPRIITNSRGRSHVFWHLFDLFRWATSVAACHPK